jgi:hypothetical protein
MYDKVSAEMDTTDPDDDGDDVAAFSRGGVTMNHLTFPPSLADSMAVISPTPPGGEIITMLLLLLSLPPLTTVSDDDVTRKIGDWCGAKALLDCTSKARTPTMR